MGVSSSCCCVCGLPVQHDHYVPTASGMLKIYRGDQPGGGHTWESDERPFRFGPEHAWLLDGVSLSQYGEPPAVAHGLVSDGVLEDRATGESVFVGDNDEGFLVLHAACWALAGSPAAAAQPSAIGTHPWAAVAGYHGQLFEFQELADDGKAWMLVDPSGTSAEALRSRARIEQALAAARRPLPENEPVNVADVLRADRAWRGMALRTDRHERRDDVRYRADLDRGLDVAGYPALLWLMKEYDGDALGRPDAATLATLEAFEVALKAAIEAGDEAVLTTVMIGHGQGQFVIYARDEQATRARIDALPGLDVPKPAEYDNEQDPEWSVFFDQLNPGRAG